VRASASWDASEMRSAVVVWSGMRLGVAIQFGLLVVGWAKTKGER
jgi:hypothetical protein